MKKRQKITLESMYKRAKEDPLIGGMLVQVPPNHHGAVIDAARELRREKDKARVMRKAERKAKRCVYLVEEIKDSCLCALACGSCGKERRRGDQAP